MDDPALKRKVTVKFTHDAPSTPSRPSRINISRPPSPTKLSDPSTSCIASTNFHPKAKVNSSATLRKTASTISSTSATPRAGSPTKLPRAPDGTLSPTFQPKVQATATIKSIVRPQTPVSAPVTPVTRPRKLTASSEVGRNAGTRTRDGSVSLHHAISFSSLPSTSQDATNAPLMRIRSKVSGIIKTSNENTSPSSNLLSQPSTRSPNLRTRTPSVSSNISQNPDAPFIPQFYPITTATPAANPHRFGALRGSPPTAHHQYQPFTHFINNPPSSRPTTNGVAKVDPASIPLPPHSPPASAVSLSSHSSASHSSVSYTESSSTSQMNSQRQREVEQLKSTLNDLLKYTASTFVESSDLDEGEQAHEWEAKADHEERKVKAVAKSNRKIADLEITNRSLLSINASLESVKHRQAKEIRELRRKLRESRLILPPRTYRAALDPKEAEAEAADGEEDSESEDIADGAGDETYRRIKEIIDNMLSTGKRALEKKIEDFSGSGEGGAKVLTPEELHSWRSSTPDFSDHEDHLNSESESESKRSPSNVISPWRIQTDRYSDDDNELFHLDHDIALPVSPPPIHITEPL